MILSGKTVGGLNVRYVLCILCSHSPNEIQSSNLGQTKTGRLLCLYQVHCSMARHCLKTLDTFGSCQRPVFSLGVSQHMHEVTNLGKIELNCDPLCENESDVGNFKN